MKKILLIMLMGCIAVNGFGWGQKGHRVTGYIAQQYLTKKASKRINSILSDQSLAMVSNWMDEVKSDSTYDYLNDWHWTTIPDGGKYEDVEANPDGKIVMMLEKIMKELKAGNLDAKKEQEYVKILVHLVGDLHQPLHVGKPGDRGGNDVKLKWFRVDSNLHRVWDSDMLDGTDLSYTEMGEALGKPDSHTIKMWQHATVRDMALESMTYRSQVYDIGNGNLSYRYSYLYLGIAKDRMLKAGVRLAGILNEIYG